MVWPGGEVKLCHLQWIPSNPVTLHRDECMTETGMKCLILDHKLYTYVKQANSRHIALFPVSSSPCTKRKSKESIYKALNVSNGFVVVHGYKS